MRIRLAHRVALAAVAIGLVGLFAAFAAAFPGEQIWVAEYDGAPNGFDSADAVAVSPDGLRVYVTGESQAANGLSDYATVAYDAAAGTRAWVARYDAGGADTAASVAVARDGTRVVVTGTSENGSEGLDADYATVAYDRSGRQLWVRRSGGPGWDQATSVALSRDGGRVFVTGASQGQGTSEDYLTIAYDGATGTKLWSRRYDGPGSGAGDGDGASALAVSPDGARLYVTGAGENGTDSDYATIAYDAATGAQLWLRRYDGPAHQADGASALALNGAGTRLYVTGVSDRVANLCTGLGCDADYATVGYRAETGRKLWARRFGNGGLEDTPRGIGVSPKGFVVVTGASERNTGSGYTYDYATVAYTTGTGTAVWSKRYSDALPRALGVSPDGTRVYVTGEGFVDNDSDVATLAYDTATGARAWVSRYAGGTNDRGLALAVAPDGKRVFVAGHNMGGAVYLTLSYAG